MSACGKVDHLQLPFLFRDSHTMPLFSCSFLILPRDCVRRKGYYGKRNSYPLELKGRRTFEVLSTHSNIPLLKNKIQLSKFSSLISIIQQFMNWAASHLADRKEVKELYKMKDLQAERSRNKKLH